MGASVKGKPAVSKTATEGSSPSAPEFCFVEKDSKRESADEEEEEDYVRQRTKGRLRRKLCLRSDRVLPLPNPITAGVNRLREF